MEKRSFSVSGVAFSPTQLSVGGTGVQRLMGTAPIPGPFKIIHAAGGNMVIAQLEVDGVVDSSWSGAVIRSEDVPLFFGTRTVTRITLTSGEGRGYTV